MSKTDDVTATVWRYEEYSEWGRRIAAQNSREDIADDLAAVEYDMGLATARHLKAIQGTTSMRSNAQRRAQSRNTVEGLYERRRALKDALDVYRFYPEHTLDAARSAAQGGSDGR